jgi:hypothetical protein
VGDRHSADPQQFGDHILGEASSLSGGPEPSTYSRRDSALPSPRRVALRVDSLLASLRNLTLVLSARNRDYSQNIQIADLNSLNAALAVIKWKKLLGFYRDLEHEHFSTYTIDGNLVTNEDQT